MFENAYTGINDCNNNPIHNGMKILIIDKNITGDVRYSFRRPDLEYLQEIKSHKKQKHIVSLILELL